MTEAITVPSIIVVCYLIGMIVKLFGDKADKFIPVTCGVFGGILGILAFYTIPGFLDAQNWLTALEVGIVSGLAATGINQVYKQFTK